MSCCHTQWIEGALLKSMGEEKFFFDIKLCGK